MGRDSSCSREGGEGAKEGQLAPIVLTLGCFQSRSILIPGYIKYYKNYVALYITGNTGQEVMVGINVRVYL